MKTNHWHAPQFLSWRFNFKCGNSNPLKRKRFRPSSMSGCNSPRFKKSFLSRRRDKSGSELLQPGEDIFTFAVDSSSLIMDFVCISTECHDQADYVIFPTSESTYHNDTCEPPDFNKWTMKFTIRKSNSVAKKGLAQADKPTDFEKIQATSTHTDSDRLRDGTRVLAHNRTSGY